MLFHPNDDDDNYWEYDCDDYDDFECDKYEFPKMDTPLYIAVHNGELKLVLSLIGNISEEERNEKPSLMHTAAARGHAQIVTLLVEHNFSLNEADDEGNTPLHLSIKYEHLSVFDLLVTNCDLNATNLEGETPLLFALMNSPCLVIKSYSIINANDNILDEDNETPVSKLITGEIYVQFVKILLANGANVNVQDKEGKTPLYIAVEKKYPQLVEILIKNGANVNVEDKEGKTPLYFATLYNLIESVEILLKNGAALSEANDEAKDPELTFQPLYNAVKNNNLKMVKLIMLNGFTAIDVQYSCSTILSLAVKNNNLEIVKCLVEHGSKIATPTKEFHIFKAIYESYEGLHSQILLQLSLHEGCLDTWKYLLKCSSKIDASTNSRLHSAVREGQVKTVEEIIKQEALNFDQDSSDNRLAVYIAVENGREEILKLLLTAGYSFEIFKDSSPLHVAATFDHTRLVEILLNAGGDLNLKTVHGETLLHFAAAAGQPTMVKFLLKSGIDINPTTEFQCESALEYALKRGPESEKYWTLTPHEYQNILSVVEMLVPEIRNHEIDDFGKDLFHVTKIRVSEQKPSGSSKMVEETLNRDQIDEVFGDNTQNQESRTEILQCCLNHMNDNQIKVFTEYVFRSSYHIDSKIVFIVFRYNLSLDIVHTIFEYNDYKLSFTNIYFLSTTDYKSYLLTMCHLNEFYEKLYYQIRYLQENKFQNEHFDCLKVLAARLAILSNNCYKEDEITFFRNVELLESLDECEQQIKEMKKTEVVSDCKITFYDVLTKPANKLAIYVKNDQFLQMMDSSYERFPAYTEFLKICIEKGVRRRDLIDDCMNFMFNLLERNYNIKFPTSEILQIFQYLSVADLHRLLAAFSMS